MIFFASFKQNALLDGDQWWAFFVSCFRYIMLSDSIILLNKLGVNFSTLPIYVLKLTIVVYVPVTDPKKSKIMRAAYQWWPSLLP